MTLQAAQLLAAQRGKHAFIHGLRDGFLFIPRGIGKLFGQHHTLYQHHASDAYVFGFILTFIVVVAVIATIARRF